MKPPSEKDEALRYLKFHQECPGFATAEWSCDSVMRAVETSFEYDCRNHPERGEALAAVLSDLKIVKTLIEAGDASGAAEFALAAGIGWGVHLCRLKSTPTKPGRPPGRPGTIAAEIRSISNWQNMGTAALKEIIKKSLPDASEETLARQIRREKKKAREKEKARTKRN